METLKKPQPLIIRALSSYQQASSVPARNLICKVFEVSQMNGYAVMNVKRQAISLHWDPLAAAVKKFNF